MSKITIENWSDFSEAYKFGGVLSYQPKNFSNGILFEVIKYFEYIFNDGIEKSQADFDHLILNRILQYVAVEINGLNAYNAQSILDHSNELRSRFICYLLSCKKEYFSRLL